MKERLQKHTDSLALIEFEIARYELALDTLTDTKLHRYVVDKLSECDRALALTKGAIANLERIAAAEAVA